MFRDFDEYQEYKDIQQTMYLERCTKCLICHKPIDPNDEPNSIRFGDDYLHIRCFSKAVYDSNISDLLKDDIITAVENDMTDITPIPEE